jgi:formate dehydrogenase subunit gamma
VTISPQLHPGDPVVVDRYTPAARANHWVTAVSLILLAISGLAFFHPSLYFLTALFGGGSTARMLHPWIGVVLFVSFLGLFRRFWRENLWGAEDGTWMAHLRDVLAAREENLPEVGKYNAGQKLVFWSMSVLILVLIVTGLIIWDQYFYDLTSIPAKRLALLIHSTVAIVAILVWIAHVYAAIWVRGTISAMTKGTVTGGWAWRHHRKWLKDLARGKVDDDMRSAG